MAVGLLAVGCSEEGNTFVVGSNGDLVNDDVFLGHSVAAFNVAPDGGGISPNRGDIQGWRVWFACDCCDSDGEFVGDESALIVFQINDGGDHLVYGTHYDGSGLTPPVLLQARDRDDSVPMDLDSAVVSFIGTQGYQGADSTVSNQVRNKQGNWVLLMAGMTLADDPRSDPDLAGLQGPRTSIWQWNVVRQLRGDASRTVMLDAAEPWGTYGTTSGATMATYNHGWFADLAQEIPTQRTKEIAGPTGVPASHVTSFGLISDGYCGQTGFGVNTAHDPFSGGVAVPSLDIDGATGLANLGENCFETGEATTVLHLFYTQVVTSLGEGPSYADGVGRAGARIVARHAPFNFNTMGFAAPAAFDPAGGTNETAGGDVVGTAMYPQFHGYNNLGFYRYADADLNDTTGGNEAAIIQEENILGVFHVSTDNSNGSSVITSGSDTDISIRGGEQHDTTLITSSGGNQEIANFRDECDGFIFGPDEGLADVAIFFTASDNTFSGGQDDSGTENDDSALYVGVVSPSNGRLVTGGTNNPLLLSEHLDVTGTNTDFDDPVNDFGAVMNRTGQWIAIAYTQAFDDDPSTAGGASNVLRGVIYRPVRIGGAAVNLENRVTDPFRISARTNAETPGASSSIIIDEIGNGDRPMDVNDFMAQGKLGYRCGIQSNVNTFWVLWEQSDPTEDRVWTRPILVDLAGTMPSVTLEDIVEFDTAGGEMVQGDENDGGGTGGAGGDRDTFTFINNSVSNGVNNFIDENFAACDLGQIDAQNAGSTGGLFVVWRKIVDNTDPRALSTTGSTTGDRADADLFAGYIAVGDSAVAERVSIGNDVHEDVATNSAITAFDAGWRFKLACLPTSGDINTNGGNIQADQIIVVFTDATRAGGRRHLFSRTFKADDFAQAQGGADALNNAFFPDADEAPTLISVPSLGDVDRIECCQSGNTLAVLFQQDNHVWGNVTTDGMNWLTQGGASDPALIDNFSSADVGDWTVDCCMNGNGDTRRAVVLFEEHDQDAGVDRLRGTGVTGF